MVLDNVDMAGSVTQLLGLWSQGDAAALEQLMPLVYDELRKLGRNYLRKREPEAVLQPTMLVHEVWIKLANKNGLATYNRNQFFALASKIMREILVDQFRRQTAAKRGGSQILVPLDDNQSAKTQEHGTDLLELNDALVRLGSIKERYVHIVDLRFFGGLTMDEIAEALQTSRPTVEREWSFARAWLKRELGS